MHVLLFATNNKHIKSRIHALGRIKQVSCSKKTVDDLTNARDMRNVITTGRSLVLKTSAAECKANAIPCRPSQPASIFSSPKAASRIYKENRVERDS
jgi:hypothetical protein